MNRSSSLPEGEELDIVQNITGQNGSHAIALYILWRDRHSYGHWLVCCLRRHGAGFHAPALKSRCRSQGPEKGGQRIPQGERRGCCRGHK